MRPKCTVSDFILSNINVIFSPFFLSTGIFVLWIGKFVKKLTTLYILKIAVSFNHLGMFLTGLGLIIRGIFYIFMTQSHQE